MSCICKLNFSSSTLKVVLVFTTLLINASLFAQNSTSDQRYIEIRGMVRDANTGSTLPYTNIYLSASGNGTVSNEEGHFQIDVPEKFVDDSLRFQFIGYHTRSLSIDHVRNHPVIDLMENIVDLSEMVIYGTTPDAQAIVKKVLENKDRNYKEATLHKQVFIRQRYTNKVVRLKIDSKKSSLKEFQEAELKMLTRNIPKVSLTFTDFLGDFYASSIQPDTANVKIRPTRIVRLREQKNDELEKLEKIFNDIMKKTGDDAYWKVRTGILSQKMDITTPDSTARDSSKAGKTRVAYYKWRMQRFMKFATLENEDYWDFLHNSGRYNYSVLGGTRIGNEEVYIIGFTPAWRGFLEGKMYISTTSFALLRADFGYAPSKSGTDFGLLGISYTENLLEGSISFQKMEHGYELKYMSLRTGDLVGVDRNISFLKKRERFLFDKTEDEIKFAVDVVNQSESSVEVMVLDQSPVSETVFNNVSERKYMKVHYVDQFDESLWKGYSIIQPIETMKTFR
ncbi:MAG: carboxypeptidase-like regulatory domain-containing protein [Salinivirgaceae bacterium]